MIAAPSPLDVKPLELCNFRELLDALASDAPMPGAGAAGGIALALAAACAGKAVAITLRHDTGNLDLAELEQKLAELRRGAIALAEADALHFKRHLKAESATAAEQLLHTDRELVKHCNTLDALLRDYRDRIAPQMIGDWQAAAALVQASRFIEQENLRELEARA